MAARTLLVARSLLVSQTGYERSASWGSQCNRASVSVIKKPDHRSGKQRSKTVHQRLAVPVIRCLFNTPIPLRQQGLIFKQVITHWAQLSFQRAYAPSRPAPLTETVERT